MSEMFVFSTNDLSGQDCFDAYHALYSSGSDAILDGPDFAAHVVGHRLDRMLIFDRRLRGVAHERLAPRVRKDGFDHFTVQLNRSGGFFADVLNGSRKIEPGEIVLFDMTRPMRTRIELAHIVTCSVARDIMEAEVPRVNDLHGFVLPARQAGLLADFMVSLTRRAPELGRDAMSGLGRTLGALVGFAVKAALQDDARSPTDAGTAKLDLARSFIEANLSSHDLSPERIAAAAGLSRTALYRLFEPFEGVSRYILNRRLARLRAALSRPSESRSIAALVYEVGFASESHCNRVFRDAFGVPPGQFRTEMGRKDPPLPPVAAEPGAIWASWHPELR